jgi:two-component system, LytTR family, response regulator LytT
MTGISILIVEDELIIADDIKTQLGKLGYRVTGIAKSYDKALELMTNEVPDLFLIDIKLKGMKDGIDLAKFIKENYSLPVIFITSYANKSTVEKAKEINPDGYLVKPFEKDDLFASIEIAFSNYVKRTTNNNSDFEYGSHIGKDSIFVKQDHLLVKIRFDELKWIMSERNYLELHCHEKMVLTRSTLKDFMEKLPRDIFAQVHRSYAVNITHVTALEYSSLFIGKTEIPVGRSYLINIKKMLQAKS